MSNHLSPGDNQLQFPTNNVGHGNLSLVDNDTHISVLLDRFTSTITATDNFQIPIAAFTIRNANVINYDTYHKSNAKCIASSPLNCPNC